MTYSDIARIIDGGCILDLSMEPNDSFVGIATRQHGDTPYTVAKLYEIGCRQRTADNLPEKWKMKTNMWDGWKDGSEW